MDKIIKLAVKDISEKYQPHTIILYGSRARGDASPDSDIDIACFVDQPSATKDARILNGYYRRTWLQFQLLEYYFSLRDQWFLGSKQSLRWLEKNDQTAFRLFSDTYKYPQNLQILKKLADYTTAD